MSDAGLARLASTGLYLAAADAAYAEAFATAYADLLIAACDTRIEQVEVRGVTTNYDTTTPAAASVVEECAAFVFATQAGGRSVVWIPSMDPAILTTADPWVGIAIDQANADVQNLTNLLIAGDGTVRAAEPTDNALLTALSVAYQQWREPEPRTFSRRLRPEQIYG